MLRLDRTSDRFPSIAENNSMSNHVTPLGQNRGRESDLNIPSSVAKTGAPSTAESYIPDQFRAFLAASGGGASSRRILKGLQERAGNQAIGQLLQRSAIPELHKQNDFRPERCLPINTGLRTQRFVGFEHESLGNVTGASVDLGNGVVLTWGQVVAIAGDEFGSIEDLQAAAATEPGRRRIRAALEHDAVRGPIPASLPAITDADREAQGGRFIDLALTNVTHFAAGGDALATWRSHHQRALQAALEAGLSGNASNFQQAQATEAFGQHFLTDMFSGGHVRTPRRAIMDYYGERATVMASAFVANLRSQVEAGLVSQVMLQVPPLLRGGYTQGKARERVHGAVGAKIDEGLAKIGGMPGLVRYFGLGLAGAVSGALHDREGRQGVVVNTTAHPQPWLAKGDALLDQSPVSRDQAEQAILAAREQLVQAQHIGANEARIQTVAPVDPPSVIHFRFDSAALGASDEAAAASTGAYLHVHPSSYVELIGHTDPLGGIEYNRGLGQRRADTVRAAALTGGGRQSQMASSSQGEANPVTRDPRRFSENRRVELRWQSRKLPPDPAASQLIDPVRQRAQQALDELGPPFRSVERFVPRAIEEMNEPLPEWRWGQLGPDMIADIDRWFKELVGPYTQKLIDAVPVTIREGDYTLAPRQIVSIIVGQLMAAPTGTLGRLIGQAPGAAE